MPIHRFVWTDLSTFDVPAAKADYGALFGWRFEDRGGYHFALKGSQPVAAVFEMPAKLQALKLPSFWMSYVRVENLEATLDKARLHEGVIIEVEPLPFNDDARVALVRDPSGAGFTLYEGPDITPDGVPVARHHHVPSVDLIRDFYADLFGWSFAPENGHAWPVWTVRHADGQEIARVEEVPEEVRGTFRYWMPCFGVRDVAETSDAIAAQGGTTCSDLGDGRLILADRQGASFMVRAEAGAPEVKARGGFAWKASLGLVCVWLAVALDMQAFWGVLFLLWTWPALTSGRADFIEPVERKSRPVLYWGLVGTWLFLSMWLIVAGLPAS